MVASIKRTPFQQFTLDLQTFAGKNSHLIENTLSNIFTMRLLGNKTHGDLAEIGITEFINQFLPAYEAQHVGKDLFRAKSSEEDILVTRLEDLSQIKVSLKAYGVGPLQLSTDKDAVLFPLLEGLGKPRLNDAEEIKELLNRHEFLHLGELNVLPLIYQEDKKQCAIMVFDISALPERTSVIERVEPGSRGRKHPVWHFLDSDGEYICEVRYGGKSANALQRGLWTDSKKAANHFRFITDGWITYDHNLVLTDLFAKALNSTAEAHQLALQPMNIELQKSAHDSKTD
ncbi:hypothetical protein M0E87_02785 [Corynebacterium sp. CCM 9185]|uniref:Uncharacterized protein n=1 Tax=Corynebacterium marambiense TaxID=2765364 RepID=A0ABS0VSK5_9CORY|nr:hypothetical protein [Corynebacterium marambiense]MBI8999752.1 hypothetical protein [Corynebacterium marambiense]MCK7662592.1 hypothetical protein [Corynebacterium marambiense]MCX7543600.1 hypothetical protein [Corynebacterium marambiense]